MGPFPPEEMGIDPHTVHMMLRELDHLIHADPEPEPASEAEPQSGLELASKPRKKKPEKAR